jgi:predicted PurR-regulated permease PerM
MENEESRLARIEKKLDRLIEQFHLIEVSDARQVMRIEQIEKRMENHNDSIARCFERLETLEGRPAKTALQLWGRIGGIALSVIVTAIVTFFLVFTGIKKE